MRINLQDVNEAKLFLEALMKHSYCTYRVTRTSKSGMKRTAYKLEMHCQHLKKQPSKKQAEILATAQSKKERNVFPSNIINKKTKCPSRLSLVGQIPSKRQLCSKFSYFQTHKAVLKINLPTIIRLYPLIHLAFVPYKMLENGN